MAIQTGVSHGADRPSVWESYVVTRPKHLTVRQHLTIRLSAVYRAEDLLLSQPSMQSCRLGSDCCWIWLNEVVAERQLSNVTYSWLWRSLSGSCGLGILDNAGFIVVVDT